MTILILIGQTAPKKSCPHGSTYSRNCAYSRGIGNPEAAGYSKIKYAAATASQIHLTFPEISPLSSKCCKKRMAARTTNGNVVKKWYWNVQRGTSVHGR